MFLGLGSCQGSLGKPHTVAAVAAAGGLAAGLRCHRAGPVPLHTQGQPVQGQGALGNGDCWPQATLQVAEGAGGSECQRGDTAWPGGHRPDQGCYQLRTSFTVLVRKSAGERAGSGGADKGVPPLPSHSTFIEDRTGAQVSVAEVCPKPAGVGDWAGRLR